MKTKSLFFSLVLLLCYMGANAQEVFDFTTTGSCASYIQIHNSDYLGADSMYTIVKTTSPIVVDAVAEGAWDKAVPMPITHLANWAGSALDLSTYPQTQAYEYGVYKALWTDDGVYMFISVKDQYTRYQNPGAQWENDGIEFYFAKARGQGKIQIIIPAMVGTTNPNYPAALDFESGSAVGSNPDYKVYGYSTDWDESTFKWAIKKTADGWDMEVYMDKDIVTNGNSATNYGSGNSFAGDINLDFAGLKLDTNTPPVYIREGSLCLLGNSNQEYANSNNYGRFKMVDVINGVNTPKDAKFNAIYNAESKQIKITSSTLVSSVEVYNVAGQVIPTKFSNATIFVSNLNKGIYFVKAKDLTGNILGTQKVVIY